MFVDTQEASEVTTKAPQKSFWHRMFGAPDLTKPSRDGLIYLLRHPKLWPAGFEWDYTYIDNCAMGLAWKTWPSEIVMHDTRGVTEAIGIGYNRGGKVFCNAHGYFFDASPRKIARMLARSPLVKV